MHNNSLLNHRLLENLNTGVVLLDADLNVVLMNPAAEALLEISGTRGIGVPYTELAQEPSTSTESLEHSLITGHSFTKREATILLHNQQHAILDYSVSPITHPETRLPCLLIELQSRDRLTRISREEQMMANQQTTRNMVRGLAHEIKNPLGGIRGAAQLLERELPDQDLREYTNIIIEEADRLRDLVDRMLIRHQLRYRWVVVTPDKDLTVGFNIDQLAHPLQNFVNVDGFFFGDLTWTQHAIHEIPQAIGFFNDDRAVTA